MDSVIDRVCDEFERAWQRREPIRIETMLKQSAPDRRDELLDELLKLEISLRQAAGEQPAVADYAERFPDRLAVIESALSSSNFVDETVDLKTDQLEITKDLSGLTTSNPQAPAFNQNSPRRSIGRYTVIGTLGRGGQADVYRAAHPTLPIEVAIKLTHNTLSEKAREALRGEAHILCDLDHPHIARIRDFDFDDGRPFMVLDLVRGRSLGQVATAEPYAPVAAAAIVAKISRAIGYAHARGVLHRDMKPDNVVIDESGQPKIIDFGMSRMRSGLAGAVDETNELSGTLPYMAPEQANGIISNTDHRVDIFALGAILYRLLVGKPPYSASPSHQLLSLVRRGQWDNTALESADVPEPLKAVCRKAMATDADQRYLNAVDMAETLERFVSVPTQTTDAWQKHRRWIIPTIAAASLLLISGLAWQRMRPSTGDPLATSVNNTAPDASLPAALIKDFELIHIGNSPDQAEFSGRLMQVRAPRENDDIQVLAEFASPAYCYLVALNPDGVMQLCYPPAADVPQASPITKLRYPESETAAFGLTDGAGQQAFILFASENPLPSYSQWSEELNAVPWPHPEATGNWFYDRGELVAMPQPPGFRHSNRGSIRETKTPTPFKELCDRLRSLGSADLLGVLFEVEPL